MLLFCDELGEPHMQQQKKHLYNARLAKMQIEYRFNAHFSWDQIIKKEHISLIRIKLSILTHKYTQPQVQKTGFKR